MDWTTIQMGLRRLCLALAGTISSSVGLAAEPLDILTDTGLSDARRAALVRATEEATEFLNDWAGRSISGAYVVLGAEASSVSRVLDAGYARLGKDRPVVNAPMEVLCGGRRANAVAAVDFILVCWPERAEPDVAHLRAVLVHEMFHHLQYDLSGLRGATPRDRSRSLGPAWMVEGTAEVAEMVARLGVLPSDGPLLFELQTPARRTRLGLSDLQVHGSVRGYHAYGVSRFAASLLTRAHGTQALLDYFRLIGQGRSQAQSFQQAFGQDLESFEAAFETVRRDFGAARDWRSKQ